MELSQIKTYNFEYQNDYVGIELSYMFVFLLAKFPRISFRSKSNQKLKHENDFAQATIILQKVSAFLCNSVFTKECYLGLDENIK